MPVGLLRDFHRSMDHAFHEPGREGPLLVEVPDGAMDLKESFLHRILCQSRLARDQESRAYRPDLIQGYQDLQSTDITGFQPPDGLFFVHHPPGMI